MGIRLSLDEAKRNLTYRRNDRKIQKVIFSLINNYRGRITATRIAKEAKISKRTLYTHYPKLNDAFETIENKLVSDCSSEIKRQSIALSKVIPDRNERTFYSLMLYMEHNKSVFIPICANITNYLVLHEIMEMIYPTLDIIWFPVNSPPPEIGSERVDMYITMCVEIIRRWGTKTNCNIQKSRRYVNRLKNLTSEASARCR